MAQPKRLAAGAAAMPSSVVKNRLLRRAITSPAVRGEIILDTDEEGRWYFERHGGISWETQSLETKNDWRAHAYRMRKVPIYRGCSNHKED